MTILSKTGLIACASFLAIASEFAGAEVPKVPVPNSPYLAVIYRFADAMLESGRDNYGPQKSGLFLSALDRNARTPLTNQPPAPAGIRAGDRVGGRSGPLIGANPQHDENLLRVLYTLSELSGKPKYRDAANLELKWFLEHTASPQTQLLPWGEHMSWDTLRDEPIPTEPRASASGKLVDDGENGLLTRAALPAKTGTHEFFRPWLLWDRCFDLAPAACKRFALGLWEHQIADHTTGAFDRQAGFWQHEPGSKMEFPRHAGFYIRTWAAAYAQTKEEQFLRAAEVLLGRFEKKRHPVTGLIEGYTGCSSAWTASSLSLAIDCDGASHQVPEPLSNRLRQFAGREDEIFCSLRHKVKDAGGFITELALATGKPNAGHTSLWEVGYDAYTTAQIGMMCVSRYENTGKLDYRQLAVEAADAYQNSLPGGEMDAWPVTFGHAISLQLAAWRYTARPVYVQQARRLADFAVERFWGGSLLPKASLKSDHYESITGADTLALSLIELHLHILHITAVRCPANTIDR